jgi:hypothetical protein
VRYAIYDGLLNTVTWFSEGKVLPLSLEQAGTTVPGLVPVGH